MFKDKGLPLNVDTYSEYAWVNYVYLLHNMIFLVFIGRKYGHLVHIVIKIYYQSYHIQ